MKTIPFPFEEEVSPQTAVSPPQIRVTLPGGLQTPVNAMAGDALHVPDLIPPVLTRRLIVLVPTGEVDEQALARRVWQLANSSELTVLYLALCPDPNGTAYQRRRLIELASQTKSAQVQVFTKVCPEKKWSQALGQMLQTGDLLVCLADDRIPGFFKGKALAQRLVTELGVPVYEFGDLPVKPAPRSQLWYLEAIAWLASTALLAIFFWIQIEIERFIARPQSTILLFLTVLVELYFLLKINEWIG